MNQTRRYLFTLGALLLFFAYTAGAFAVGYVFGPNAIVGYALLSVLAIIVALMAYGSAGGDQK